MLGVMVVETYTCCLSLSWTEIGITRGVRSRLSTFALMVRLPASDRPSLSATAATVTEHPVFQIVGVIVQVAGKVTFPGEVEVWVGSVEVKFTVTLPDGCAVSLTTRVV